MKKSVSLPRLAGVALLFLGTQTFAQSGPPDVSFTLDQGIACKFELAVDIWLSAHRVTRTFPDSTGRVIEFSGGKGNTLRFTNTTTGNSLTLKPTGSIDKVETLGDGSKRITTMGPYVWIFFPTDTPEGPSTIQYTGRVVVENSPSGVSTLKSSSGRTVDICAAIS